MVGASGLVGSALLRALPGSVGTFNSRPVAGLRQLEASDLAAFRRIAAESRADTVFFPAAQPNVEWCEAHPLEAEAANLDPLRVAIAVARERGALLVAYSSDYVFDGAAGPYREDDTPRPLSAYGRIKLALEVLTLEANGLVIRTTGVFGREPGEPRNFVLRLAASLARGEGTRVPVDQISTPTYSDDLAAACVALARARERGIWHVANPDLVSRYELALRVAKAWALPPDRIAPAATADLGQHAARPLRGGLRIEKLRERGIDMRVLDDALADLRGMMRGAHE